MTGEQPDRNLCPGTPKKDWPGQWIWTAGPHPWRNSYAFFRKRFRATGRLRIDIAADTRYELYLDGARIARGAAPCVPAYTLYDTHQVDVRPGDHMAGVIVHHVGEDSLRGSSRPGLLVEIRGRGVSVGTDSSWKAMPADCFRADLPRMMFPWGFPEECDLRRWPDGWTEAGFDDGSWPEAESIGDPGCEPWTYLIPRDVPLLESRIVEAKLSSTGSWSASGQDPAGFASTAERMAARRRSPADGAPAFPCRLDGDAYAVLDFGRELTGHVRLRLAGAAGGCRVELGYDETVDARGLPDPRRTGADLADGFTLSEGRREVEVFGARGFRHLLVDVPAGGGLELEGARVEERTCPVPAAGTFRCSDGRLDALHRAGLATTLLCMQDAYVDGPSRDRVLSMASYQEGLCTLWATGTASLWREALYLFAQDRLHDGPLAGAVQSRAPGGGPVVQTDMMYYVCSLADYVRCTGDRRTGDALFDVAADQFRLLAPFLGPNGLLGASWPGPRFSDRSVRDGGGVSAAVNAAYLAMHRKAAGLARLLRREGEAREIEERRTVLTEAFRAAFWDSGAGLFSDPLQANVPDAPRSPTAGILSVWADATAGEEARSLLRRLLDPSVVEPVDSPAMAALLVRGLFRLGMDREAMDCLIGRWTPIGTHGTFADGFSPRPDAGLCHGGSAAPVALLPRYVLGVRPLEPNWSAVSIVPHTGDLEWAEGTVPTPHGEIRVRWDRAGGGVRLEKSLPSGIVERAP